MASFRPLRYKRNNTYTCLTSHFQPSTIQPSNFINHSPNPISSNNLSLSGMEHFTKKLAKRKQENALRVLPSSNHSLVDFCSNDYLGFATVNSEIHNLPSGATGSRLLKGNHTIHEKTEAFLADYHNSEAALLFNSGYTANLGLISTITERTHIVLYDELSHASLREGIQLSHAKSFSFKHNSLTDLKEKLSKWHGKVIWVITESVFSMDGDIAPLHEMASICHQYQAHLIVDEAHALGVFGMHGKGLINELKLENKVFARIVTFGKALGSHGAAVLGSKLLIDYLVNFCRAFIYTTALPPSQVAHILSQYKTLANGIAQEQLTKNIALFTSKLYNLSSLIPSKSAIQCIVVPGNNKVKAVAASFQQAGFDVRPILSPTVPSGQERLRICLHSFNTTEEINSLTKLIKEIG